MTEEMGLHLDERLPVYPKFINETFLSEKILKKIESL
jgi:FO synthase subunit 1